MHSVVPGGICIPSIKRQRWTKARTKERDEAKLQCVYAQREDSNNEQDHTPSTFARRFGLECENFWVRLKGILVEQDSEVRVVSVRPELIGDVRNMITGFLKNDRMKLSTGSGDNMTKIFARRAWIPLKKGKVELMMHEIAVNCVNVIKPARLGLPKFDHGKNQCPWFRKRTCSCTRIRTNRIVGSRKGGTGTSFGASS